MLKVIFFERYVEFEAEIFMGSMIFRQYPKWFALAERIAVIATEGIFSAMFVPLSLVWLPMRERRS
jgi:hypothetical protein